MTYKPIEKKYDFKVYLGKTKGDRPEKIYLTGFSWDCDWYWGGGYISNKNMHTHFNSCFLDTIDIRGHLLGNFVSPWYKGQFPDTAVTVDNGCSIWEDLSFFLDDAQFTENEWWRIKDLYKQFYIFKDAAGAFQYGGHCTSSNRSKKEINKPMAIALNHHIEHVIILQILIALKLKNSND